MSATKLAAGPEESDFSTALAQVEPFAGLSAPIAKSVCGLGEVRRYSAGETIFSPGQFEGTEFLFIWRGQVKATLADPASGSMLIEELGETKFFAFAEAVAGEEYAHAELLTLTAEKDTDIVAFDAAAFRALFQRRPLLTRSLAQYFAKTVMRAKTQVTPEDLSPQRRVFAALLEYVERDAVSGMWRVERMPKHRELAEKAEADESTAAGAIAHLIQEGVARRDYPGLIIDDMTRLHSFAR